MGAKADTLMPYDYVNRAEYEFLRSEFKRAFLQRIEEAMANTEVGVEVMTFARLCADLSAAYRTLSNMPESHR